MHHYAVEHLAWYDFSPEDREHQVFVVDGGVPRLDDVLYGVHRAVCLHTRQSHQATGNLET